MNQIVDAVLRLNSQPHNVAASKEELAEGDK